MTAEATSKSSINEAKLPTPPQDSQQQPDKSPTENNDDDASTKSTQQTDVILEVTKTETATITSGKCV